MTFYVNTYYNSVSHQIFDLVLTHLMGTGPTVHSNSSSLRPSYNRTTCDTHGLNHCVTSCTTPDMVTTSICAVLLMMKGVDELGLKM